LIIGNVSSANDAIISNPTLNTDPLYKILAIIASVVVSFVLLFIEWRKAQTIIASRDISYAFTSIPAYRYYAIKSYSHFCFCILIITIVNLIQNSRKNIDLMAFFVYFRFKGWKRLIFAEAPRQFFNFMFIYDCSRIALMAMQTDGIPPSLWGIIPQIYAGLGSVKNDQVTTATYIILLITFLFWTMKMISLIVALFVYIPLLCMIRGNLKEYCVHKIDKR
jgi:hypothetical protein